MSISPLQIGSARQLFIDESHLAHSQGVRLSVNVPEKTNEKIIIADRPWEDRFVGPYCTVMDDDGLYRMWYESYYSDVDGKRAGVLCYAESDDGRHWRKPNVGLIPFRGESRANNIVFPPPGFLYHGGTVFKDPVAPSSERYKLIYMTAEGVLGAHSPDGLSWRVYDRNPLMFHQSDTQNVCFWDDRIGKYVAYVRQNRPVRDPNRIRNIGRSETADFLNWPAAEVVLAYDDDDPPDVDLYNSAAIKYPHAENAYFIITSYFNHVTDTMEPRLATSRDGIAWNRPSRKPFICLGDEGAFDSAMIHTCVGQFQRGDEWYTYYRGTDQLHSTHGHRTKLQSPAGVISRVVSRPDGFVSMDAMDEGSLTTVPVRATGSRLELNFAARGDGYVIVELRDAADRPLKGFEAHRCRPLAGDSLAEEVYWDSGADLTEALREPVRMHLRFRRAQLFAWQFVE